MNDLELYKEMYYYEMEVKEKLNARFTNPFNAYVLLIGGMGYFLNKVESLPNATKSGLIIAILIIYGIALGNTGFLLYKAYHNHTYLYVRSGKELKKYKEDIIKYYDKYYKQYYKDEVKSKKDLIKEDFNEYLIEKFSEAAAFNQEINIKRTKLFLKVGKNLLFDAVIWIVIFFIMIILKI